MAFTKIEQSEINSGGALRLPDRPSETMPPHEIKAKMDYPAKEVLFPAYNRLIDELEATTAAASIGAVAPSGVRGDTVQKILNNMVSTISTAVVDVREVKSEISTLAVKVTEVEAVAHSHSNKSLLDTYTQSETDLADAVTKKHSHDNKTVLDKFGESSGVPTYNGSAIGSVSSVNGKTGEVVLDASDVGALPDDTHIPEISVTQVQTSGIRIAVVEVDGVGTNIYTPEGAGTGDMKKSDYDSDSTVKNANGIKAYVRSQISGLMVKTTYDSDSTVANAGGIKTYVTSQISTAIASLMEVDGSNASSQVTFGGAFTVGTRGSGNVGTKSSAFGSGNVAKGNSSHAEGGGSYAGGDYAHAEGHNTIAGETASHAEGQNTIADGNYSHVEGYASNASGIATHAEGYSCDAFADYAHAGGYYTQAGEDYQTTIGKYNSNKSTTLFEVGNGTSTNARSNAFEVYSDGTLSTDNGTTKVKLEDLVEKYIEQSTYSDSGTTRTFSFSDASITTTGRYDYYCDVYGKCPSSVTASSGSMTITFKVSDGVTKCGVTIK